MSLRLLIVHEIKTVTRLIHYIRAEYGIYHILPLSCTSLQLRNIIDKVTDPRSKRIHTRYSIPDTRAVIRFGDRDIQAKLSTSVPTAFFANATVPVHPPI